MDVKLSIEEKIGITLTEDEFHVLVCILKDLTVHPRDADKVRGKLIKLYDLIVEFKRGINAIKIDR